MDSKLQTGGQLSVKERDEGGFTILDGSGGLIAICATWSLFDTRESAIERAKQNQANAQRLVACWNACEGITDAELSHGPVLPLHRHSELVNQRDNLQAALSGLILFSKPTKFNSVALNNAQQVIASAPGGLLTKHPAVAQRDELLAALEEVVAISDRKHDAWDRAHAAIAKAKAGAQ